VADLADAMGAMEEVAKGLVEGTLIIDRDLAGQLASALDTSREFWLHRQSQYSNDTERLQEDAAGKAWLRELPIRDMIKFGWIKAANTDSQKLSVALQFFDVKSVSAWKAKYRTDLAAAAFRTSLTFTSNPVATAAWLRQAEIQATAIECRPWNPQLFRTALAKIRALTRRKLPVQFLPELTTLCGACGVALVITRAPEGCRASGATRFLTPNKALIVMSFRYRSDDQFWFTFFHEAGHLLLHSEKALFLEDGSEVTSDEEAEANEFASSVLIPTNLGTEFQNLAPSAKAILRFSVRAGISPGVIVGQMQHGGRLAPNRLNSLKRRWAWTETPTASNLEMR
jgi:HTH-type transcriptional regulator/antitoxin HigA